MLWKKSCKKSASVAKYSATGYESDLSLFTFPSTKGNRNFFFFFKQTASDCFLQHRGCCSLPPHRLFIHDARYNVSPGFDGLVVLDDQRGHPVIAGGSWQGGRLEAEVVPGGEGDVVPVHRHEHGAREALVFPGRRSVVGEDGAVNRTRKSRFRVKHVDLKNGASKPHVLIS